MYCKIEGANTMASTGQVKPAYQLDHWPFIIYGHIYVLCIYIYIYLFLPKHSPHASHPANLAPQAKSASSMYFLESSWAWSDNWSFYNIFGFSFNFLCCHRAEEQHELNLSLQIVWSPWMWIPGTVCRTVCRHSRHGEEWVNGKWNVESENLGFHPLSSSSSFGGPSKSISTGKPLTCSWFTSFQHSGCFSCNVKTLTPWIFGDIMIDHERT